MITSRKNILKELDSLTSYDRVKYIAYWLVIGELEKDPSTAYQEVSSMMLFTEKTWKITVAKSNDPVSIITIDQTVIPGQLRERNSIRVPLQKATVDEVVDGLCLVLNELGIQRISIQVDRIGNFGRHDYYVDISKNEPPRHEVPSIGGLRADMVHRGARPW